MAKSQLLTNTWKLLHVLLEFKMVTYLGETTTKPTIFD